MFLLPRSKKAVSIVEFALIIVTLGMVLTMMNVYIKRGMQLKIKQMVDNFMGLGEVMQAGDLNPSAKTTSNTVTTAGSMTEFKNLPGSATQITSLAPETVEVNSDSRSEDQHKFVNPNPSFGAKDGVVNIVPTQAYTPQNNSGGNYN